MQQTRQTRSMFLTRALERILADKELKKSYNAQLKRNCQMALGNFCHNYSKKQLFQIFQFFLLKYILAYI